MAEPRRSALQPGGPPVSSSRQTWAGAEEEEGEEEEDAPIYSLSKSCVDVLTASGPGHPWDPALTRQDVPRSSSTDAHAGRGPCTLRQLLRGDAASDDLQAPRRSSPGGRCGSPPPGDRWSACSVRSDRWSACSTRSDCSTPDSVIWRGGAARPQSLVQGASSSLLASPASPPPHCESAAQTPAASPPATPPPLPPTPRRATASPTPASPTPEDHATHPPTPPSTSPSISPDIHRLPDMETTSPSGPPGGGEVRTGSHLPDASEDLPGAPGSPSSVVGGEDELMPLDQIQEQALPRQDKSPWQPGSSSPDFCVNRRWKYPLVSSQSDPGLSSYRRCDCGHSRQEVPALRPGVGGADGREVVKAEQRTPGSPVRWADAAVQTASPPGSCWNLGKNASNSHMGSHSILGSPPGSRLNLRSPQGSTSNLVSPSSSMFLEGRGEDQKEKEKEGRKCSSPVWEASPHVLPAGRRRSCLKVQGAADEKVPARDELGRRGSMKQVQWDEEGMTWDIYGSSMDAAELSLAVQRHLDLRGGRGTQSPSSPRKEKPNTTTAHHTEAAKVTAPDPAGQAGETPPAEEGEGEAKAKAGRELERGSGNRQGPAAEVWGKRTSNAMRDKGRGEEEEGAPGHQPPSRGRGLSLNRGVTWSLTRPCCGGSSKDPN